MSKTIWSVRLAVLTLLFIVVNYVAFYLDDLLIYYGWAETSLMVYGWRAVAFPVAWYVQVIEPYTLGSIPVLSRSLNYCVELIYFYSLVWLFTSCIQCVDRCLVKPIQHYFDQHAQVR